MKIKLKATLEVLTILIALASFVISIRSCQIAKDSIEVARKANQQNEDQFIASNRPYLIIRADKFEDGKYLQINRSGSIVKYRLNYAITNRGTVTATHIRTADKVSLTSKGNTGLGIKYFIFKPGELIVGPGEKVHAVVEIKQVHTKESSAIASEKNMLSGENRGIDVYIAFVYGSEIEDSIQYHVFDISRVKQNNVHLFKSGTSIVEPNERSP